MKGFSALTVLVLLVLLTLYANVGSLLIAPGEGEGGAVLAAERSLNLADAGLRHAMLTLKQNWGGWNTPSSFPQRSIANGIYDATISDDDDGDGNTSSDSNSKLVVTVQGTMGDSTRYVRATVSRSHGAFGSAIYTERTAQISGNVDIDGDVVQGGDPVPALNTAEAINQARANLDNGYSARADGNYFQGEFPSGQNPQSLNGVIFVNTYANGNQAYVPLSGNIATTSPNPAVLIVLGSLHLSGTVNFNGLIYVTGTVTQDVAISGTVDITGGIITANDLMMSGNVDLAYNAGSVVNGVTSNLFGADTPTIEAWAEYFP